MAPGGTSPSRLKTGRRRGVSWKKERKKQHGEGDGPVQATCSHDDLDSAVVRTRQIDTLAELHLSHFLFTSQEAIEAKCQ